MKKHNPHRSFLHKWIAVLVASMSWALLRPVCAHASAELDRQFALQSIGFLQSVDNVDGLFWDYLRPIYQEYFSKQSRFVVQDLSRALGILSESKMPLTKWVEDAGVLGQLAKTYKLETLVRTRVQKEGPKYKFKLEWIKIPSVEKLGEAEFAIEEDAEKKRFSTEQLRKSVILAMDEMIAKVPFKTIVTGRDSTSVTVSLGKDMSLENGDELAVATLEEVKKHPLLGQIVDWHFLKVGRIRVEMVDGGIAFCKVLEEERDRRVARYQKITAIYPKPKPEGETLDSSSKSSENVMKTPPRFGFGLGALSAGGFSRQYSSLNSTIGKTGGGFYMGAKAEGQVWITREIFGSLDFAYGFSGYSQSDIATGVASAAAGGKMSFLAWQLHLGYNYYLTGDVFGPKGYAKLGFQSIGYTLPASVLERTGSTSFKGLTLGIGGDLPMRKIYGVLMEFNMGVLTSATDTDLAGSVIGSSSVQFMAGAYYQLAPRMRLRVTMDVVANSMDLATGASVTQRVLSFGPGVAYYF